MKGQKTALPDFLPCRAQADAVLSVRGNRLKLVEALLFLTSLSVFSIYLGSILQEAITLIFAGPAVITAVRAAAILLAVLFWMLVVFPLWMSMMRMAARMQGGEFVPLTELFAVFSDGKEYRRALRLSARQVLQWGILAIILRLTYALFNAFLEGSAFLDGVTIFFEFAEDVLWAIFLLRRFPVLYFVYAQNMTVREARQAVARISTPRRAGVRFWLSWLPRILLGLATAGILLLADVIPRMCLSYFCYVRALTPDSNSSEVPNHE